MASDYASSDGERDEPVKAVDSESQDSYGEEQGEEEQSESQQEVDEEGNPIDNFGAG